MPSSFSLFIFGPFPFLQRKPRFVSCSFPVSLPFVSRFLPIDLQRLARRGRGRRCLPALLSAQRAFGDGPFLLPGARPGHPEAQNAPGPAREAQNGVDSRSGILQTPKELVESPFPLRNQTWKETFCSWTRKPNSYSLTAIRKPAPTLVRVIPAEATVLPPALAGSRSVGGGRRFTMPLASATEVALSRLTRILLLVAVALCLGAPTAGADAAKKLDNNLAALWTTILQTPDAENPFGTGGAAFACVDLGGTVAPFAPGGVESCTVKPGTKIFVTASSVECSTFEGNGTTEAELRTCAREGDVKVTPTVTVDDKSVPVTEAETPLLNITLPADNIFGQLAGKQGLSVGHGWVTLLHPLTPGTHTIKIHTATSDITTEIIVKPGH
jgi:hypothetical protein